MKTLKTRLTNAGYQFNIRPDGYAVNFYGNFICAATNHRDGDLTYDEQAVKSAVTDADRRGIPY